MKKTALSTLFVLMTSMALQANVTINSASYQEELKVQEDGENIKVWVKAKKVVPGSIVRYVNTLNNSSQEKATKLVVNNPIPKNMEYVANSASCQNGCAIYYSIDSGKTFKKSSKLFLGYGDEKRLAKASEYTNIRWVLNGLNGQSESSVEYKAQLK